MGITGNFASGKNTVAKMFSKMGQIIDADRISHELIRKGKSGYAKIVKKFGKAVLSQSKEIDRKTLAMMVFGNKRKVKILNAILHPLIIKEIKRRSSGKVTFVNAALIFEAGLRGIFDRIILVNTRPEIIIKRAKERDNLSNADIRKRLSAQMKANKKLKYADYIINNDGSVKNTYRQALRIKKALKRDISYAKLKKAISDVCS